MSSEDKRINLCSTEDLAKYGIMWLTGEADPYSLRVLCDLNDQGQEIIKAFLGLSDMTVFKNWNSRNNATGSFLMPRSMYMDLIKFILFHVEGCDCAYKTFNGFQGYMEHHVERASDEFKADLIWNYNRGKTNNRNVHAMSGRIN